ncbi:MAG TPA: sigma-70 family RNA polymerase sigma factor [Deltaproteobacteria bacterium]|nr:sigma-70 family RNA polymerase sigma factor [Deltaproteobacteria bacterium]
MTRCRATEKQSGREPTANDIKSVLSDEQLVKMILNGTPEAFDVLVRRYQRKALAVALNMTGGNIEDARDITQDVFVKVFRSLKGFRFESLFSTWFYRMLINQCHDFNRRKRLKNLIFKRLDFVFKSKKDDNNHEEEWVDQDRNNNPLKELERSEIGIIIKKAVNQLPEGQKKVFILKNYLDMNINQIAEITGMAPGTIKSHLFRATRKLRENIGPVLGM